MKTLKVIKIGGNIINNEVDLLSFLKGFSNLIGPKILVHGGGKLASNLSNKYYIQSLGGPSIGAIYYLSITFDEFMRR